MTTARQVLIVDDEPHVRSALARVLRRMAFDPVEASSGEDALALVRAQSFACALVDLRMPGMGGLVFVGRARALDPGLPTLVVTGHADAEDARVVAEAGACDFLVKPWSNAELQLAVVRAIEGREGRRPAPGAAAIEEPPGAAPDLARAVALAADALRAGELPAPFAPPAGLGAAEIWRGTEAGARQLWMLPVIDRELARRTTALAAAGLPPDQAPADPRAAISTIGMERTALLFAVAAVERMLAGRPAELRLACARAAAMQAAAVHAAALRVRPARAFLTGLFSQVGAAALAAALGPIRVPAAEQERVIAERHAAVSAWIAGEWGLPAECVLACALHHGAPALRRADPALLLLWACAAAADAVAGGAEVAPLPDGDAAARVAGLSGVRADLEGAARVAVERLAPAAAVPRVALVA